MIEQTPIPTEINLHKKSRIMNVSFDDGSKFEFTCEFLRVYSPSAEVRGHSEDEAVLQVGKADVNIEKIEPVGTYAVTLHFDDGHNTGIYSWDWLYHLGQNKDNLWQNYLKKMEESGQKREPSNGKG